MGKLYYCVGLPRSGKSTYCQQWVRQVEADTERIRTVGGDDFDVIVRITSPPRAIVSGDAVRQALHGHAYLPEAEGHVFATMDTMARALLLSGFDVMIDETSTTEATISRYLKIDPDAVPVWFDASAEVCIERALATNRPYLVEPIKRMAAQLATLKAEYPVNLYRLREYALMRQNHDVDV
jgi:predicted kinase